MQTRHRVADDFCHPRHVRIRRRGQSVRWVQRAVSLLTKLSRGEWLVEFPGNGGRYGTPADRDTAGENPSRLDEEKIRRARANIDQQRATAQFAVVVTKGVIERHRRQIDDGGA